MEHRHNDDATCRFWVCLEEAALTNANREAENTQLGEKYFHVRSVWKCVVKQLIDV